MPKASGLEISSTAVRDDIGVLGSLQGMVEIAATLAVDRASHSIPDKAHGVSQRGK
jgi:hypothetical protein